MPDKIIKIRIQYDGGPAHSAKITDAETGAVLEGALRVELDATDGRASAVLYCYEPIVDVTTDAKVLALCPGCQKRLNQDLAGADDYYPQEGA